MLVTGSTVDQLARYGMAIFWYFQNSKYRHQADAADKPVAVSVRFGDVDDSLRHSVV